MALDPGPSLTVYTARMTLIPAENAPGLGPIPAGNTPRITPILGSSGPWGKDLGHSLGSVRFGSPWSGAEREHEEALEQWFQSGCGGPAPQRARPDVLEPFRDAWLAQPKKLVSIRLDEWLLLLVKQMAAQTGLRYQEILRGWLEEGLRRAIEEGLDEDPSPDPNDPEDDK